MKVVATHNGSFHADEVFAIAALQMAFRDLEVVRSRDDEDLERADLRVDVGSRYDPEAGDFDHHQREGAGKRDNGVAYASFGLVWKHYGEAICGDALVAAKLDETLVQWIDAQDNGQAVVESKLPDGSIPIGVGGLIGGFNLTWDEERSPEIEQERFDTAVKFARGVIERELRSVESLLRGHQLALEAIKRAEDPRIIELKANAPWREAVRENSDEALFVVYPKSDGWGVQAVPAERGSFANRKDLPEAWAGLADRELAEVSGVEDAIFCHRARFMAAAASREGALALARKALAA